MRWASVFLLVAALLSPLGRTDLGRQFTGEAKWIVAAGIVLAVSFFLVQRRAGAKVRSQRSGGAP